MRESLPSTLPGLVDRRGSELDGEALVFPTERASFRAFADATADMARRLHALGVGRGDRVGFLLQASVDAYALLVGTMRLGAVPVPVNTRFKARELRYVVRHAGMRLLVAEAGFGTLLGEADVAETCRVVLGTDEPALVAAGDAVAPDEVGRAQAAVSAGDDALILYTSGTTANPKGCVHRHSALIAQGELLAERFRLTGSDRFWTPLPFFHVGGIGVLAGTLTAGCATLQMGHFEPAVALDQLEEERCTVAFPAFETIWLAVLNQPRFPEADLRSIRVVVNVGVPTSLRAMQARLPAAPQVSCFGSTETCAFACIGVVDDPLEVRVTTSGLPLRDVEVRTVDAKTGRDTAPGEVGELLVRGPTIFVRYHDDAEATARAIDADGWFHSGDLGRVDADGRVAFVGRLKDMLKVGGENVAAAEVESYLLTHPAVEIVQVVGVPDARYTEVPAAFVQLRAGAGASEAELIDFCRGQIATFKIPRYVRFVQEWPMSGTKIQKFRLRDDLIAELSEAGTDEAPKLSSAR